MRNRQIIVIAVLAAGIAAVAGSPAQAKDGRDVLVRGTCSAGSSSKLKLSPENGRIEVEFEVDQNRNGVRWTVVLRRGVRQLASVARTTRAPSGSFTVRRVVSNAPGRDTIAATARRRGEVCTARTTL
jgi:hypothetical protein